MSDREKDLEMLAELLEKHLEELSDVEVEAFADMRLTLKLYGTTEHSRFRELTEKQREWVTRVRERIVPQYANLVSRGLAAKGDPTPESRALDAMLAKPKVLRPPPKKRED
jgi:hypothetical protein